MITFVDYSVSLLTIVIAFAVLYWALRDGKDDDNE